MLQFQRLGIKWSSCLRRINPECAIVYGKSDIPVLFEAGLYNNECVMRNIRLLIEYEGTGYAGWQCQKNGTSIQEVLCKAVERTTQEPIKIYGASRTDAGVHALGQVAHFKTTAGILSGKLLRAVNFYLPRDITVKEVAEVPDSFHSQYNATAKVYRYTLFNDWTRTSLDRNFCFLCGFELDMEKMRAAAGYLLGTHDFTSFATKASCKKNRIRTLYTLEIVKKGKYIYFTIEGNGFLYNMVRSIVGTLIEVGRGKKRVDDVDSILESRDRDLAGPTAPAKGLCLMEVKYESPF
ncbi:MAG: tRNA pseudouridine(38-40) synthase TruA [Candidatus Brocadiaceae bacterium]|nr:tRNA pseudouridine(38-40) synthase TruA [Candidatus Brocadiaceae bacterium]